MLSMRTRAPSILINLVCKLLCALSLCLSPSYAIISINDLKPGMKGIGKTVFEGVKVESFSVEVIDVLKGSMPNTDVVLVRVGGKNIERVGGVCAGMSGSPVLINGELAGAIAHAEPLSDTTFAYMTPSHDMLSLLKYDEPKVEEHKASIMPEPSNHRNGFTLLHQACGVLPASPLNWDFVMLKMRMPMLIRHLRNIYPPHRVTTKARLITPLMVQGLSARAIERFKSFMGHRGMFLTASPSSANVVSNVKLEMGSAIAIQFAHGDISLSALGTLTYAAGGKFVALGHPLLQRGYAQFGLAGAYIHSVVRSLLMPFKVGSPLGKTIGVVTQDRERGVAGYLERSPNWVQLHITVEGNTKRQVIVSVTPDEELLPIICGVVMLDAVDKAFDRVGSGTAELKWEVSCNNRSPLVRSEKIYSETDVASECALKFTRWLMALLRNEFEGARIERIDVNISVTQRRMTARICKLSIPDGKLRRGSEVELAVHLQPFHDSAIVERLKVAIPKDAPGEIVLVARGKRPIDEAPLRLLNRHLTAADFPSSFDELVRVMNEEPCGTEVLIEIWDAESWRALKLLERQEMIGRFIKPEEIEPEELLQQPTGATSIIASGLIRPIATARVRTDFVIHGQVEVAAKVE